MKSAIGTLIITILTSMMISIPSYAYQHKYRLWLTDKDTSIYTLQHPEEYLSHESIERRTRQGIAIDMRDIPVNKSYIASIKEMGCHIVTTSRWMNTVVVALDDTTLLDELSALPFVDDIECVWHNTSHQSAPTKLSRSKEIQSNNRVLTEDTSTYGYALQQTEMLNLDSLHALGYRGNGMKIAVLDAGFYDVDNSTFIDSNLIIGKHDFPHGTMTYKNETHGAEVLSCMAANEPGMYVGTATEAQYWLIVTEDVDSEYPIEEDYWVAGAEMADSAGVDIINTSLAYTTFDDESMNYTTSQLDGQTALISRAAGIAAQKGILVVAAAGNEYYKTWQKIGFPADAMGIITVGSVGSNGEHSPFSSCGYTADQRVKPDVMALGSNVFVVAADNSMKINSGTSFAAPIISGAMACLWQSHPEWNVEQLIANVQRASSQHTTPDNLCGYGIPDIYAAYLGKTASNSIDLTQPIHFENNTLYITAINHHTTMSIYDCMGRCISQEALSFNRNNIDLSYLNSGIYIVVIPNENQYIVRKIIITP